jgi:hypothetical protein
VSESSAATVRADILQKYSDLFGTKTVNGRQVNVEDLIARLTRATRADVASLMQARHQLHNRVSHRQVQYEFLDPSTQLTDPDGTRDRCRHRQGMLDGFFGRKTRRRGVSARRGAPPPPPPPPPRPPPGPRGRRRGTAVGSNGRGGGGWQMGDGDAGSVEACILFFIFILLFFSNKIKKIKKKKKKKKKK